MIYIASPYSNPSKIKMEENFKLVSLLVADMVSKNEIAISPITYGHTLLNFKEMPVDWEFWNNFCISILKKCDKLIVYMIDGWDKSIGVTAEIQWATDNNIPVEYLNHDNKIN